MALQYPLELNFKLIALAPRIFVRDASGKEILYVHQKTLALKEHIKVYSDQSKARQLCEIRADRIIDFSATYHFSDMSGNALGALKNYGWKSLWNAKYDVQDAGGSATHHITEDNPWVKIGDALLGEIPIIGMFTGYFLHPSYTMYEMGTEKPVMRLKKEPAFFEGRFSIDKLDEGVSGQEELRLLLGWLTMVQFMRRRG